MQDFRLMGMLWCKVASLSDTKGGLGQTAKCIASVYSSCLRLTSILDTPIAYVGLNTLNGVLDQAHHDASNELCTYTCCGGKLMPQFASRVILSILSTTQDLPHLITWVCQLYPTCTDLCSCLCCWSKTKCCPLCCYSHCHQQQQC